MTDITLTAIPELLTRVMRDAAPTEAEQLFNDADMCADRLGRLLIHAGRLMETQGDGADVPPDEWRSLGMALSMAAELARGMNQVVELYRWRQLSGCLPALVGRADHDRS